MKRTLSDNERVQLFTQHPGLNNGLPVFVDTDCPPDNAYQMNGEIIVGVDWVERWDKDFDIALEA